MGHRKENLRVLYNNINGLKIKEFLKSKAIDKYERKKKIQTNVKKVEKVTGVVATLRKWDTNILCLSESQCAWEKFHVRNNV